MEGLVTKEDVKNNKASDWIKIILIGDFGSGKSHDLGTFPNSLIGYFGAGEEDTIKHKNNLLDNLYGYKVFIPYDKEDTKRVFDEYNEFIKEARTLALAGKILTLGIDTLNYLIDYRWMYINQFQKIITKSGETDLLRMYGTLSTWFKTEVKMQLMSMPCNVVITCHEKVEFENTKDLEDMLPEAKKRAIDSPITANIVGGARNEIGGLASYIFFKEQLIQQVEGKNVCKYMLRTNKGGGKKAKNRIGLPELIDVTNKSLYQVLRDEIGKVKSQVNSGK